MLLEIHYSLICIIIACFLEYQNTEELEKDDYKDTIAMVEFQMTNLYL